jgi:hypothetical protein
MRFLSFPDLLAENLVPSRRDELNGHRLPQIATEPAEPCAVPTTWPPRLWRWHDRAGSERLLFLPKEGAAPASPFQWCAQRSAPSSRIFTTRSSGELTRLELVCRPANNE